MAVWRLVFKRASTLAIGGLVIGLAGSLALVHVLKSRLVGIQPLDPLIWGAAALTLVATVVAASLAPARNAARASLTDAAGDVTGLGIRDPGLTYVVPAGTADSRDPRQRTGMSDCGRVRQAEHAAPSTSARGAGNRAERFIASTSVNAFSLMRIITGVLCRATDAASSYPVVDARAKGRQRRPISRPQRPRPQADMPGRWR